MPTRPERRLPIPAEHGQVSRIWDLLPPTEYGSAAARTGVSPAGAAVCAPAADLRRIPVESVRIRPDWRLFAADDPRGAAAERLRYLRLRLNQVWNPEKVKRLLITSPLPHDGKSTIALNLAVCLAEEGKRNVLLLDGDLHRASLSRLLSLDGRSGVAECLTSRADPYSRIRRIEPAGIFFLPAGSAAGNPGELLQGESLPQLMETLSRPFDWILIDSPPVAPLTDALSWKEVADASLLLARAGHTPPRSLEEALQLIGRKHVLAILLNGAEGLDRLHARYYKAYPGAGPR